MKFCKIWGLVLGLLMETTAAVFPTKSACVIPLPETETFCFNDVVQN